MYVCMYMSGAVVALCCACADCRSNGVPRGKRRERDRHHHINKLARNHVGDALMRSAASVCVRLYQ